MKIANRIVLLDYKKLNMKKLLLITIVIIFLTNCQNSKGNIKKETITVDNTIKNDSIVPIKITDSTSILWDFNNFDVVILDSGYKYNNVQLINFICDTNKTEAFNCCFPKSYISKGGLSFLLYNKLNKLDMNKFDLKFDMFNVDCIHPCQLFDWIDNNCQEIQQILKSTKD